MNNGVMDIEESSVYKKIKILIVNSKNKVQTTIM